MAQVGGKVGPKIDTGLNISPVDLGARVTNWKLRPNMI